MCVLRCPCVPKHTSPRCVCSGVRVAPGCVLGCPCVPSAMCVIRCPCVPGMWVPTCPCVPRMCPWVSVCPRKCVCMSSGAHVSPRHVSLGVRVFPQPHVTMMRVPGRPWDVSPGVRVSPAVRVSPKHVLPGCVSSGVPVSPQPRVPTMCVLTCLCVPHDGILGCPCVPTSVCLSPVHVSSGVHVSLGCLSPCVCVSPHVHVSPSARPQDVCPCASVCPSPIRTARGAGGPGWG